MSETWSMISGLTLTIQLRVKKPLDEGMYKVVRKVYGREFCGIHELYLE